MSNGNPFSQYQYIKNNTAHSFAVRLVFVGINRTSEFRQLVMVSMQSYPLSSGRGPTKSKRWNCNIHRVQEADVGSCSFWGGIFISHTIPAWWDVTLLQVFLHVGPKIQVLGAFIGFKKTEVAEVIMCYPENLFMHPAAFRDYQVLSHEPQAIFFCKTGHSSWSRKELAAPGIQLVGVTHFIYHFFVNRHWWF